LVAATRLKVYFRITSQQSAVGITSLFLGAIVAIAKKTAY